MSVTSALVLFIVIWFLVMFVTLPIGRRTQGDDGEIVQGTHASAPTNFNVKRTMIIVSCITFVIWAIVTTIIVSGWITVRDIDMRGVMN